LDPAMQTSAHEKKSSTAPPGVIWQTPQDQEKPNA